MSVKNKTIEQKMEELRSTAQWFESDEFSLSDAATRLEAANKLAREIEHDLSEMENTITVLKQSFEEA